MKEAVGASDRTERLARTWTALPVRAQIGSIARRWRERWASGDAWVLALLGLALAFRFPAMLNAGAVDSDAAVVGLQAMHILRGEWSWTLWGAPYQAPVDSILAAMVFAVLGPTPLALRAVPVIGQLAFVWFVFRISRMTFTPRLAAWLTLPVVFTPMAVNYFIFGIQRQACITLFAASVWLLAGARHSRRPALRLALGSFAAVITLYVDLYAIQWIGPLVLFAILCTFEWPWRTRRWLARLGAVASGQLLGWPTFHWLRSFCDPADAQMSMSLDHEHVRHNLKLLWDQCLPWALSYKIFASRGNLYPDVVAVPAWFRLIQLVGAALIGLLMASAAVLFWVRRIPWPVRRLGILAIGTIVASLAGFLVSGMPVDMWATRYLAPVILMMPFALAPAAHGLGGRRFAVLSAPYLAAAAVGGWLSYGIACVDGGLPVRSARGTAREELEVGRSLRDRHVSYAAAQYWLSYRLTFLFRENPVVVPLNPREDRHRSYRLAFDSVKDVAYIFHPSEPRASPADEERWLKLSGAHYERYRVADFTVFVEHRK